MLWIYLFFPKVIVSLPLLNLMKGEKKKDTFVYPVRLYSSDIRGFNLPPRVDNDISEVTAPRWHPEIHLLFNRTNLTLCLSDSLQQEEDHLFLERGGGGCVHGPPRCIAQYQSRKWACVEHRTLQVGKEIRRPLKWIILCFQIFLGTPPPHPHLQPWYWETAQGGLSISSQTEERIVNLSFH